MQRCRSSQNQAKSGMKNKTRISTKGATTKSPASHASKTSRLLGTDQGQILTSKKESVGNRLPSAELHNLSKALVEVQLGSCTEQGPRATSHIVRRTTSQDSTGLASMNKVQDCTVYWFIQVKGNFKKEARLQEQTDTSSLVHRAADFLPTTKYGISTNTHLTAKQLAKAALAALGAVQGAQCRVAL